MANSGSIYSSSCADGYSSYGARWLFKWTAKPHDTKPGVTVISYDLITTGRYSTPTYIVTELDMTVTDHNGNVVHTYESVRDYMYFTDVLQHSGSFEINHNIDGSASFTVHMATDIYEGGFRDAYGTEVLDTNMPYHPIFIDTGNAFVKTIPYIDDGTKWLLLDAYIDNGINWDLCS